MREVRAQEETGGRGICCSLVRSNLPSFPEVLAQSCEKNSNKCEEKCLLKELCLFSKNSIKAEMNPYTELWQLLLGPCLRRKPSVFCLTGYWWPEQAAEQRDRFPSFVLLASGLTLVLTIILYFWRSCQFFWWGDSWPSYFGRRCAIHWCGWGGECQVLQQINFKISSSGVFDPALAWRPGMGSAFRGEGFLEDTLGSKCIFQPK